MNDVIVKTIKKLIENKKADQTTGQMMKTSFVKGYMAALADVEHVIALVEALKGGDS